MHALMGIVPDAMPYGELCTLRATHLVTMIFCPDQTPGIFRPLPPPLLGMKPTFDPPLVEEFPRPSSPHGSFHTVLTAFDDDSASSTCIGSDIMDLPTYGDESFCDSIYKESRPLDPPSRPSTHIVRHKAYAARRDLKIRMRALEDKELRRLTLKAKHEAHRRDYDFEETKNSGHACIIIRRKRGVQHAPLPGCGKKFKRLTDGSLKRSSQLSADTRRTRRHH